MKFLFLDDYILNGNTDGYPPKFGYQDQTIIDFFKTNFDIIEEKDIPQMAKYAAKEANPLYPVPKLMNARQLSAFYYKVRGNKNGTK